MSNEKKSPAKKTGNKTLTRLIGALIILLIVAVIRWPRMLFFLNPAQQEALGLFRESYLGQYLPVQSEAGGFDWLRLLAVIVVIAGCVAADYLLQLLFGRVKSRNRRAATVTGLLANVLRYAITIFCIIYCLNILGADVMTVIAGLGILALVVGFGAQSLIEDIFAGLFIVFEGRFYVGDIISVDGFRGTVRSIGIVSTQIADTGGNIKIINNSDIRTLTNLSEVTSIAIAIVSIAYGADLVKAEKVITDMLETLPERYPDQFSEVPSYLGVEELGESSVDLKVTAKVDEANIYTARRILNRELKLALDAGGIEIPFPQVTVWQGKED